jgi:hypothetical protein
MPLITFKDVGPQVIDKTVKVRRVTSTLAYLRSGASVTTKKSFMTLTTGVDVNKTFFPSSLTLWTTNKSECLFLSSLV